METDDGWVYLSDVAAELRYVQNMLVCIEDADLDSGANVMTYVKLLAH